MTDDEMAAPLAPEHPAEAEEPVAVEFHKPKPVHNWREFLSEIGVVVLGILIALGGEQVVEAVHWRDKASDAREALRGDVTTIYQYSAERVAETPCINVQLDILKQRVLRSGATLAPAPTTDSMFGPAVIRTPDRGWDDTMWRSVLTEQVGSHFGEGERNAYAALYNDVVDMHRLNQEETAANGALALLASPLPLDPALRGHLIEAIEAERHRAYYIDVIAVEQMATAKMLISSVHQSLRDPTWLRSVGNPRTTFAFCRAHHLPLAPFPKL